MRQFLINFVLEVVYAATENEQGDRRVSSRLDWSSDWASVPLSALADPEVNPDPNVANGPPAGNCCYRRPSHSASPVTRGATSTTR